MPFKYVFNCGSQKFQILKNGSDYQGAWPPLVYKLHSLLKASSGGSPLIKDLLGLVTFEYIRLEENHTRDSGYSVCFWISAAEYPSGTDWCCIDNPYVHDGLWSASLETFCRQPYEKASYRSVQIAWVLLLAHLSTLPAREPWPWPKLSFNTRNFPMTKLENPLNPEEDFLYNIQKYFNVTFESWVETPKA